MTNVELTKLSESAETATVSCCRTRWKSCGLFNDRNDTVRMLVWSCAGKVSKITEELCGCEISSSDMSRATALLDEEFAKWRNRPLGAIKYLILDARYEKVRQSGCVVDCAVLIAIGVDSEGRRSVLGVSVSLSEAEAHWREFFKSLLQRGLHGVELIVSDAHAGLKEARQACFTGVPWQRCQFHLLGNALQHVPTQEMKREVMDDLRMVLDAADVTSGQEHLRRVVRKYEKSAPKLAAWMEHNVPESMTVLRLPPGHRSENGRPRHS